MKTITGLVLAGACAMPAGASARDWAAAAARLDSLFSARYAGCDADEPGAAVIVAAGDTVIYERYFGVADMETGERVGENTLFNIASVSKQFTVMGLLRLAGQGLVKMTDRVSDHFDYPQPFWSEITLADLAGHTSGLPDSRDRSDRMRTVYANDSTSMAYFPTVGALKFAPGTAYDYLNPSFLLLARVIEQASGMAFTDYQRRYVFGPAGMERTVYFDPAGMPEHTAHGYELADAAGADATDSDKPVGAGTAPDAAARRYKAGGRTWEEYDYGEETFFATRPDGGIYATARDMLAWERALAAGTVAGKDMVELAYTPRIAVTGSPWSTYQNREHTWYGQGFFVDTNPEYGPMVYHTGDNGGFQAFAGKLRGAPEQEAMPVIIVLENRHDLPRWPMVTAVAQVLRDAMRGE